MLQEVRRRDRNSEFAPVNFEAVLVYRLEHALGQLFRGVIHDPQIGRY